MKKIKYSLGLLLVLCIDLAVYGYDVVMPSKELVPDMSKTIQTLVVINPDDAMLALTLTPKRRKQGKDLVEIREETSDVLLIPDKILLRPFEKQTVHIKWMNGSVEEEQAYRILINELLIPSPSKALESSLKTKTQFVKSLYVIPKGAKPDVSLLSVKSKQVNKRQMLEIAIKNKGTKHQVVRNLLLKNNDKTYVVNVYGANNKETKVNLFPGRHYVFNAPLPDSATVGNDQWSLVDINDTSMIESYTY